MSLLEVRNLRVHIPGPNVSAKAVDGVDLQVGEGEAVGVVGESGSGKTVLALSILGLQPGGAGALLPESSIRFKGEELVAAPLGRLRRVRGGGIAMIFQEPMTSLNPVFSVGNQIGESLGLHRGLKGAAARTEVQKLLQEVGIPDPKARAGDFPHELSGGMRQRVMIAMALAGEPGLLIADEPTTALDSTNEALVLRLLKEVQVKGRMGLVLISHDLSVVSRVCERVVVLYGGQVVESGPTRDILENPKHPYTVGLLNSRLHWEEGRRTLEPIPGEVPEAGDWPGGCRFHTRCSEVFEKCRGAGPALVFSGKETKDPDPISDVAPAGRAVRCWLAGQEDGS